MIFGILVTIIVLAALTMGGLELREQYIGNKRKVSVKVLGHVVGVTAVSGFFFSLVASTVFLISCAIAVTSVGNKQDTISDITYKVAPNSDIDTASSDFKFVSVETTGELVPKSIPYSTLNIDSIQASRVEVHIVEHTYTVVAPFSLKTITTITVK